MPLSFFPYTTNKVMVFFQIRGSLRYIRQGSDGLVAPT